MYDDDKRSDGERDIDEQFNINVSKERRAEIIAEGKKNRTLTESEANADNIDIAFQRIKTLEAEVKRILEHLGI